jgi:predicted nucleic acid-binding Zn ribbon protein
MDEAFVPRNECVLHREVMEAKLTACDKRVDGILEEIREVRQLQKNIQYMLLFIALGVICTLIGVVLGRGFDFGWIIP